MFLMGCKSVVMCGGVVDDKFMVTGNNWSNSDVWAVQKLNVCTLLMGIESILC